MRTGKRRMTGSRMVAAVGLLSGVLAVLATPAGAGAGAIERVSVASDGTQGDNSSYSAAISADGRFVAFDSIATNLVPGDTNGRSWTDAFVHDRQTGTTERVSVGTGGIERNNRSVQPALSAGGH